MRFTDFCKKNCEFLEARIRDGKDIKYLSEQTKGGWESWLQVEIFLDFRRDWQNFFREVQFPGSSKLADFMFESNGIRIWVEIKTRNRNGIEQAIDGFQSDISKLSDINLAPQTNTVGALVVFPYETDQAFAAIVARIGERGIGVDSREIKYFFYRDAGRNGSPVQGNFLDKRDRPNSGSRSLVVYYVKV